MSGDFNLSERSTGISVPRFSRQLAFFLILLALVMSGMAVRALTLPSQVAERISIPPLFDIVGGGLGAVVCSLCAWRVLKGRAGSRRLMCIVVGGIGVFLSVRVIAFAEADYDRGRLPLVFLIGLLSMFLFAASPNGVRR